MKITKSYIIWLLVIAVIALFIGGCIGFYIKSQQQPLKVSGSSHIATLDIVAGDLPKSLSNNLLDTLSNSTNTTVRSSDVSIRNYKKEFNDAYANSYTVQFTVDISSVKASYDITSQVVTGRSIGMFATCSAQQKTGYMCTNQRKEYD